MLYQLTFVFLLTTCVWSATVKRGFVEWFEIMPAKEETVKPHKILSRQKPIVDFSPYEQAWSEFKDLHGKSYEVEEEKKRFQIFRENVFKIEEHNKKFMMGRSTFTQGINQFADLTNEEYKQYNKLKKRTQSPTDCSSFLQSNDAVTAKSVDWRKKGYVTEVKNQGQCGSCWSFSTTGSLEGQNFRKYGKLISLSEQQLVDCSTKFGNDGCNGGLMDQAFKYIKKYGIESEDDYPYVAKDGDCKYDVSSVVANDTGCIDVKSEDEDKLKKATSSVGPISVAIDASHESFQRYQSGVYDEDTCSSTQLDHGVLVVGYGTNNEGQDYWIVKNSWGTSWGEDGYIKMSRNKNNQCGIATQASYPLV